MQNMKNKGGNDKNSYVENSGEVPKQKRRHIVSWSSEEDDILREQIEKHGTDNWTIIASKFKDKTTRQCRRRWYTYLNSDFKKGGWSPEEDLLLCEAQKIFGNRWTEIAKVVSGRTDNAVKNRFSTLCKKRAKHEALATRNNEFINLNNKRVIFANGLNTDRAPESAAPLKKMRSDVTSTSEVHCNAGKPTGEYMRIDQLLRPPFTVLAEKFRTGTARRLVEVQDTNKHGEIADAADNNSQGTFLKKDDPRILALLQQAELLSSLAFKVCSEDTDQSLENVWQVLQDYLNQTKDANLTKIANPYSSCNLVNFKEYVADSSCNEFSQSSLRQPDLHISSPSNSDYSNGSTRLSQPDERTESSRAAHDALLLQSIEAEVYSTAIGDQRVDHLSASEPVQENGIIVYENTDMEFNSPIQVTPLFRSLAAVVPTPNFSESERRFLLSALGPESTSPNPSGNTPKHPPCKRVLLHSL